MKANTFSITKFLVFLVSACRSMLLIILCLLLCSYQAYPQPAPLTIAVIQPYNLKEYSDAVEGFLDQLHEQLPQDFNTVMYESPQGLYTALRQQKHARIDLILTVGTAATLEVAQAITDIPIVFTMVLDPGRIQQIRPDIVGTSMAIPVDIQFRMLQQILPDVEKIGVLYDPQFNADLIEQSRQVAEQLGLHLLPFPVKSPKEITTALTQLSRDADVLWGIVDDTVYTSQTAKFIIQQTVRYRIPFIGFSAAYVKAGALLAVTVDPKEIGRQSAKLVRHMLARSPFSTLKIETPVKIDLTLNLFTARLIGRDIPETIIKKAKTVYE